MDKDASYTGGSEAGDSGLLKPGDSFGNFRVVKCIAAGLIATYYLVQHIRDLHEATVCVLHPRTTQDPECMRRLELLKKQVAACEHESIPQIRECARVMERDCLFLEPVSGKSLSHHFSKNGDPGAQGIGSGETQRILALLLGALGFAHAKGLDHRDLDSDCILVQPDGAVKILGLGLKAAIGPELFESIISASISPLVSSKRADRLNSFDMISPEYRAGNPEDRRVDIFAVGLTGYWLLTGRKPDLKQWRRPSELVEGLSFDWDRFLDTCLQKDSEARYQGCRAALIGLKGTERKEGGDQAGFIQRQIDRIPVPKGIRARGELAVRAYRLSVIGVVGLTLTALAASYMTVTFMEPQEYRRDVAMKAEGDREPNLAIEVLPPVAKVEFADFDERFVTTDGALGLVVQPGNYKLRVTAPRHADRVLNVMIEGKALARRRVELEPAWTDVTVHSEPGAKVVAVDKKGLEIELGATDGSGLLELEKGIFAGTYDFTIDKPGYEPFRLEDQRLKFDEATVIEAPLVALPSTLTVRTRPEGARILVNGEARGRSPLTLDDVAPSAHYLVEAHLEGYRSSGRRFKIGAGEDKVVDLGELTPRSGELAFEISFAGDEPEEPLLEATEVRIDGKRIPLGDPMLSRVPEGRHSVSLEHPRYRSETREILIEDRRRRLESFVLEPRPAEVELRLPEGVVAQVRIGEGALFEPGERLEIPTGQPVEVELRMRNHMTATRVFELKPTERAIWAVRPVPIPGPERGQSWTVPYLGISFTWIPEGSFTMGSPPEEMGRLPSEKEATEVIFSKGFWMSRYEVTQAQHQAIIDTNPSEFRDPGNPVESLTWDEARQFCRTLSYLEEDAGRLPPGYTYRLPTEAEWEYAARAGSRSPFTFGNRADATDGNFRGVYPPQSDEGVRNADHYGTLKVGSFEPNAFGLFDVHGNVAEWTADRFRSRHPGGRLVDPLPISGSGRIAVRGGSWEDSAVRARSASRIGIQPEIESNAIGFRLVLAPTAVNGEEDRP